MKCMYVDLDSKFDFICEADCLHVAYPFLIR